MSNYKKKLYTMAAFVVLLNNFSNAEVANATDTGLEGPASIEVPVKQEAEDNSKDAVDQPLVGDDSDVVIAEQVVLEESIPEETTETVTEETAEEVV